jgi:hypothetical protein
MKILGYQKDFFDSMIYTYGVDNSIVLDRTILLNLDKNVLYKEMYNLNTNHNFFSSIEMFFGRKTDPYKQHLWDIYHGKEYHVSVFYFDGYAYLLYYKVKKTESMWSTPINVDEKNVYDVYKGEFNLLLDANGVPIRKKANPDIVEFSKKYKLPYFSPSFKFFFPFLAIKDHEKYFDTNDVYQRIESFLLNASIGEADVQSNDNKITAHGFDTKASFRKGKEQ